AVMLGDTLAPFPAHHRQNLVIEVPACETPHVIVRCRAGHRLQHGQPPGFLSVDADDLAPSAARIGEAEKTRPALVVNHHELARAEIDIDAVRNNAEALIAEAEGGDDRAVGAVAADEIAC